MKRLIALFTPNFCSVHMQVKHGVTCFGCLNAYEKRRAKLVAWLSA